MDCHKNEILYIKNCLKQVYSNEMYICYVGTECHSQVISTPALYFWVLQPISWLKFLCHQSVHVNSMKLAQIIYAFPVHSSPTVLSFDTIIWHIESIIEWTKGTEVEFWSYSVELPELRLLWFSLGSPHCYRILLWSSCHIIQHDVTSAVEISLCNLTLSYSRLICFCVSSVVCTISLSDWVDRLYIHLRSLSLRSDILLLQLRRHQLTCPQTLVSMNCMAWPRRSRSANVRNGIKNLQRYVAWLYVVVVIIHCVILWLNIRISSVIMWAGKGVPLPFR
jgi:hypothetical protein